MGQDDPPNYDDTLVTVPLDGLDPLKNLAAFQVRFSVEIFLGQLLQRTSGL